ncbi:MAG TPA: hypothetical protein EYO79_06210 [Candidatus Marinimicrobia bacterium]|nr:hypothetical protein [Candidatus Neomarinimicrobiota bacterium]
MRFLLLVLAVALLSGEEGTDSTVWSQYARGGLSHDQGKSGGHGYYRINRKTVTSFRDLRLFGYGLGDDSYIYLRYKSSTKYSENVKLYNFTTVSYQKNTRADLAMRYHFNQGFGYFINEYNNGHVTGELGHAYDMSDFLNDTRKTSYLKGGIFWDHELGKISTKLETEWFKQISDVVTTDLSRVQFFAEISYQLNNLLSLIMGFEQDYYTANKQSPQSYYFSLGWQK